MGKIKRLSVVNANGSESYSVGFPRVEMGRKTDDIVGSIEFTYGSYDVRNHYSPGHYTVFNDKGKVLAMISEICPCIAAFE
ncbi:hypothetical protein ACIXT9_02155 [Bacteroides fragilis]